jgi:protein-S-isoprenylcysteine O-methyltransferase Ste14
MSPSFDPHIGGRIRRVLTVLGTRVLPLVVVAVVVPALHAPAVAAMLLLYSAWTAGEAWIEDPITNREARSSEDDRGTRVMVLGAHLLSVGAPFAEQTIFPSAVAPAWMAAGALIIVFGAALRLAAVVALGPYFTAHIQTKPDQTICRQGPYRYVRHPSYVGLFLINVGMSVILAAPVSAVIAALASCAAIARRVAVEEKRLSGVLGAEYDAYRNLVPRYCPLAKRWSAAAGTPQTRGEYR